MRRLIALPLLVAAIFFPRELLASPLSIYICSDGTFADPITDFAMVQRFNIEQSSLSVIRTGKSDYMRGCQFDSTVDKFFVTDLDISDQNRKIYRTEPDNGSPVVLQFPIPGNPIYDIFGGFAIDTDNNILYFPDNIAWEIEFASSVYPLKLGPPIENAPEVLNISPVTVNAPTDIEIDLIERKLYIANGSGGITRANLDGSGGERVIDGGPGVFGLALDTAGQQIFYVLDNNQVWTANIDGSNPTDLTPIIGPLSNPSHRRMDIDFEPDSGQIYWVEYADPNPPFGDLPTPGKLRRANPDGTGATDVISDIGYRGTYISFQYGTLTPHLHSPLAGSTHGSQFELYYSLDEMPAADSVKVEFQQADTSIATLTMVNERSIVAQIKPFESDPDQMGLVSAFSGFPLPSGTYDVVLSYRDLAGHDAAFDIASNVQLIAPTATPTITPTSTVTPQPSPTASETPTPIVTVQPTATISPSPTQTAFATPTIGEPNSTAIPTPTISVNSCTSAVSLSGIRAKGRKATLSIRAKKGATYRLSAKPLGIKRAKAMNVSLKARRSGTLKHTFSGLASGLWEFSFSEKVKRLVTKSCPVSLKVA